MSPADDASAADPASLAAREWRPLVEAIAPLAERLVPQMADPRDPLLRHEMYRLLMSQVAMANLAQFIADEAHPDFSPLYHGACNTRRLLAADLRCRRAFPAPADPSA